MSIQRKAGIAAAIAAAGAAVILGSNAFANVAETSSSTTTTTTTDSSGTASAASTDTKPVHTEVTGDEAASVTATVVAADPAVTVTTVEKDADGSYDVRGTKDGAAVRYDVSADLATVTQGRAGGPGGGKGQRGGSSDTPVTGDEAAKVTAAVQAQDGSVTVTEVRKDPDGSYDALGTQDGATVMFNVSADLQTISQASGRGPAANAQAPDQSTASAPATT